MAERLSKFDKEGSGRWEVPTKGILNGIPAHEIPADALKDALNVFIRDGILQVRTGLTEFAATVLTGRPTGAFNSTILATPAFQADAFQNDAFQVTGTIPSTLLVIGTTRKLYVFFASIFNDVTGTPDLTAGDANLARFTSIQIGAVLFIIHSNGIDDPRQWDSGSPNFTTVAGTPPKWSDLTTISNRIIGIVPPYDVRWGQDLSLATWPATNIRVLADTTDQLRAIANFGLTSGAVYKSNSIWNIVVTGGSDAAFYRFDYRLGVQGPASPAALVNCPKAHYYMTEEGRVGRWDGFQHTWEADGVWDLVKLDLDTANSNRIHGAYDPKDDAVWFYYPRIGDAGENKGVVMVKMPAPKQGIAEHISFMGRLAIPVSASTDIRLDAKKQLVFTSSTRKGNTVEGTNDAGTNFTGFWQTGLAPVPGPNPARLGSAEAFFERSAGYGSVTYKGVYSNVLDTPGGSLSSGVAIDLTAVKVFDLQGQDVRGRFLGSRFEFTTPVTIKYKGVTLTLVDRDK